MKDFKVKEASAKEERDTLNSELQQLTKEKTKSEFVIKDLKDEVKGDNKSKVMWPDLAKFVMNMVKK